MPGCRITSPATRKKMVTLPDFFPWADRRRRAFSAATPPVRIAHSLTRDWGLTLFHHVIFDVAFFFFNLF